MTLLVLAMGLSVEVQAETGCQPGEGGVVPELPAVLAKAAPKPGQELDWDHYEDPEGDNDGDGYQNDDDAFPNDERDWDDTDGDGVGDNTDHFPDDPEEWFDSDCDGIGDNADDTFDGDGGEASVERESSDGVYWQDLHFDMSMSPDGVLTVTLKVELQGVRDKRREKKWEKAAERVWKSEDVVLDLEFVDEGGHNVVQVKEGIGPTDSGTFYADEDGLVIAHEIAHHLGLNDEYEDEEDPDRFIGEEDSIMRINWDDARPYPRHFAFIRSHWNCDEEE